MEINEERVAELHKHAIEISMTPELIQARLEIPNKIMVLSRLALGMDPAIDIADVPEPEQSELLIIMKATRNIITGNRDEL
jgi:hypothetical protein